MLVLLELREEGNNLGRPRTTYDCPKGRGSIVEIGIWKIPISEGKNKHNQPGKGSDIWGWGLTKGLQEPGLVARGS